MSTHAHTAAKLLIDAGEFFRALGEQNPPIKEQMAQNASVFDQIAELVIKDPFATLDDRTYAELAARLLGDAASFFRTLAEQNSNLKKQMNENAFVYEKIAALLRENPNGTMG